MLREEFWGKAKVELRRRTNRWTSRVRGGPAHEHLFLNGRPLRIRHRGTHADLEAINQCLRQCEYEIPPVRGALNGAADRFYQRILAAGHRPLIVDGGANIGASTLWFASRYPAAEIIAVEPAADNCALLRANAASFDVTVREAGLGPTPGRSRLVDTGFGAWAYRTEDRGSGPVVTMITLADLLAESGPGRVPFILKLDIEGSEGGLFGVPQDDGPETAGGAAASPAGRFPILILELHDWMLPTEGSSRGFLRFHLAAARDLTQRGENVFSLDYPRLLGPLPTASPTG